MSECLDADALLDVGRALDWRVEEGLSHLRTCTDCRVHLETLQRAREGLLAGTPVTAETLHRIYAALHEASRGQVDHARRWTRLPQAVEACAAGIAALLVLVSNGVPIEGPAAAVVGFSLGAILMLIGTTLARRFPTFGTYGANL
jgi:hypothetical protein